MENIVVKTVNGVPVRLKDIGSVEDSYQEQTEIVRVNGKPGVIMRFWSFSSAKHSSGGR